MTFASLRVFAAGAVLGAPWALSFSPYSWWWVGFIQLMALAVLATVYQSKVSPSKSQFFFGLGFGFGAYGIGTSWLYISLNHYGGLPAVLAVAALVAFSMYLALFPALATWGIGRLFASLHRQPFVFSLVWASVWGFSEWLRGVFLTGFPWLSLGDAVVDSPVANLLPWLGSYGAEWLVLVVGLSTILALSQVLVRSSPSERRMSGGANRKALPRFSLIMSVLGGWAVLLALCNLPVNTQATKPFEVTGVQTNVDQSIKFDPDRIVSNMEKVFKMGDQAVQMARPGGLLLMPETVNPLVWSDTPAEWQSGFRDLAAQSSNLLVMGAAVEDQSHYFNSIVALTGQETADQLEVPSNRHDKRHLVPFGEMIPWGFAWFVALLNMPMGEFTAGTGPVQPFELGSNRLIGTVCYEDAFSGEFATLIADSTVEPTVFLNLSNLAWFGRSWALDQHAQMGRTRSAEHRKPTLRATNTGLSGIVDAHGRWVLQVKPHAEQIWQGSVQGSLGKTFFAQWGQSIWFALWVLGLGLALGARRKLLGRS